MNRKHFITTALLCCFMVCLAVMADLNGKWTGTLKTPDGNEIPLTYTFKVDGSKLTGTAESPQGVATVDDGKIDGSNFTFKVTVDGNEYPHAGKVYADSVALDITFSGQKIHTVLKKSDK
jgi:hypothetical protein